jgi:FecR protein
MSNHRAFSRWAAAMALALPASAQSVISTHSGVIHFFEGAVYLGDQPLESHLGKFPSVPQGAELRTAEGRAEVLLTPGVFLRMGEQTKIRMVANNLADTRVELQTGSAIVDSGEPNADTSVSLIYKNWRVHFLQKGVYRIDSDPPSLSVRQGAAEVFVGSGGQPVPVEHGMSLPLAGVLVPERSNELPGDTLSDWADGRGESIAADNAITAQIDEDPPSQTTGLDSFTYFPSLGVSSLGMDSSGLYNSYLPYQPGFNSIYLPGYTYPPLMLGLMGRGLGMYVPRLPWRTGVSPGVGTIIRIPRAPVPYPAPVRAAPSVAIHGVGHR